MRQSRLHDSTYWEDTYAIHVECFALDSAGGVPYAQRLYEPAMIASAELRELITSFTKQLKITDTAASRRGIGARNYATPENTVGGKTTDGGMKTTAADTQNVIGTKTITSANGGELKQPLQELCEDWTQAEV